MKELGRELNKMLDLPLPELSSKDPRPAGEFKKVLWKLWDLINGKVEELLVEKTDWTAVQNATYTFQSHLFI